MAVLESFKVQDYFLTGRPVYSLSASDTPHDAFKHLAQYHILSAPVYDGQTCVGLLDSLDLVSFLLSKFDFNEGYSFQIQALERKRGPFQTTPIRSIINFSNRNLFVPVKPTSSVQEVMKHLTKVRRVPIIGNDGKILGIISQKDIIKFISQHLSKLGKIKETLFAKTLDQIRIAMKPVLTVEDSSTILDAFRVICDKKVGGVAVRDGTGRLVHNIGPEILQSLSHIRFLLDTIVVGDGSGHDWMSSKGEEGLKSPNAKRGEGGGAQGVPQSGKMTPQQQQQKGSQVVSSPVSPGGDLEALASDVQRLILASKPVMIEPSAPLLRVLEELVASGHHRAYVVDSLQTARPIGIISLTDIIQLVLDELSAGGPSSTSQGGAQHSSQGAQGGPQSPQPAQNPQSATRSTTSSSPKQS